jgi:16S rRNA processing protein RimM
VKDDRVVIGRVVKPHGLRGEVVVEPLTDFPERFVEDLSMQGDLDGRQPRTLTIETVRWHGGRALVGFAGVRTVDEAEALRDTELSVAASETAPRPEGFVFHYEVEGCVAVDTKGNELGKVAELADVAGRALLVLETPRGEREVPFTSPIVVSVDLPARRVILDPPKGLLD